ncbi:MAG: D-alanyl-D-alanine carboxypeptidase family protein [Syntrophomonadaceae bacterium]
MTPIKLCQRIWALAALIFIAGWLNPAPVTAAPRLTSQYYCLVDAESGQYIHGKNANVERPMASTTKIMTAILVLEYANLDEVATVSATADRTAEYTIGLRTGQKLPVGELLKVALIRSANDAAVVLAEHVAGDEQFFAYLMSKKAFLIGAPNTRFQNASGLPAKNHYSTAYDLAQIGRYAVAKPVIKELVSTVQTTFKHPAYLQPLTIRNTNAALLVGYRGADGIKTGTTDDAGKCLVASSTRGERSLIAVVLKSGDRQGDCMRLMDYGYQSTARQKILDHQQSFKSLKVNYGEPAWAEVVTAGDVWLWQGEDIDDIEKIVRLQYNLDAPIMKDQVLGEVDVYINDRYFRSVALVSQNHICRQPWLGERLMKQWIENIRAGRDDPNGS